MDKGVYINLYHGRTYPEQDIDDWGSEGPTLGPFSQVQVTYLYNIRALDADGAYHFFTIIEDMVLYDGVYYGDWSITADPINEPTPLTRVL